MDAEHNDGRGSDEDLGGKPAGDEMLMVHIELKVFQCAKTFSAMFFVIMIVSFPTPQFAVEK